MELFKEINALGIRTLLTGIVIYQRTLSPDHGILKYAFSGPVCRFHPTCSEYTYAAIKKHGYVGILLGIKQIIRCNPFSK